MFALFTASDKRRGSVLLLSLFFMMVLFLMAVAMFKLIPSELHAANRSKQDLMGHYVANAGARHAIAWLEDQMEAYDVSQDPQDLPDYTPDLTAPFTYPNLDGYRAARQARSAIEKTGSADWDYDVQIRVQDGMPPTLVNFDPRVFTITSTALLRGRPVRRVDMVVRQASFASFAFYTEQFGDSQEIQVDGNVGISGPVHTNDFFRFRVTNSSIWNDPTSRPYFLDEVTHNGVDPNAPAAGDGNVWLGSEAPYDANGPVAGRYEKVFEGGRNSLRVKDYVQLPTSSDSLAELAYFGEAGNVNSEPLPLVQGVYLNSDANGANDGNLKGGILIHGRVDGMEMRLDSVGNQVIRVYQNETLAGQKVKQNYTQVSYNPPKFHTHDHCAKWEWQTPPAGAGGGVSGGKIEVCVQMTGDHQHELKQNVPTNTTTVDDYDRYRYDIFEVTEAPITLTDQNGQQVTVSPGQTALRVEVRDEEGSNQYELSEIKVFNGQPNGTIFVAPGDADGDGDTNSVRERAQLNGIKGIVKGNAEIDDNTGLMVRENNGDLIYKNKTVATDLSGRIELSGDLLQFSQDKFDANNGNVGGGTLGHPNNWRNVSLDPNQLDGNGDRNPELSPNNDHVLGLISRDIWMVGPKNSNVWNGNDGYNDVYAVMLAGRTEVDNQGNIQTDANGRPITTGGFGTYRWHRDRASDGLGNFRIHGGVIQGTTGANSNDPNDTNDHSWKTGSVGYDVEMVYDSQASRQGLFPTYPEFAMIRYVERSVRER